MFLPLSIPEADQDILENIEDFKDKVNKCVHALMTLGQERNPIKKADINKVAFPTGIHYRASNVLIIKANMKVNTLFGMRLFELSDKARYLLVNAEVALPDFFDDSAETQKELAVMYFILMGIFVSPDQKMTFEEIEKSIKQPMSLSSDQLKDYMDIFMKKLYIKLERHQEMKLYGWGERAIAEVDPEMFFKRFLDLADDPSERSWPELRKRVDSIKEARIGTGVDP